MTQTQQGPPTMPVNPAEWLRWQAATPLQAFTAHTLSVLAALSAEHPDAERLLAAYHKHRYDTASALPTENPFQYGDLLEAYRRRSSRTWPAPKGGGGPRGLRCSALARGTPITGENFFDLIDQEMFTRAVTYTQLASLTHQGALADLSWSRDASGQLSYEHPDQKALGPALIELRRQLWAITVHEGYAYREQERR